MEKIEVQILHSMIEYPQNIDEFLSQVPLFCFSKKAQKILHIITELAQKESLCKNTFLNKLTSEQKEDEYILNLFASIPFSNYISLSGEFIQGYKLQAQRENALKMLRASDNNILLDMLEFEKSVVTNEYKTLQMWQEFYANKTSTPKFKTYIQFLDSVFEGGFEVSQLVLISGDPEAGKTTLGLQIIENIATYTKVCFFSFEFTIEQYVRFKQKENRKNIFNNLIIINDGYELYQIAQNIKNLYRQGVRVFLIDSQMRITSPNGRNMEEEESLKFSLLAKMCHSMGILIFLIVQTSKGDRDNPMGSKKGGHEASIIIRIEHCESKNKELREFSENERLIVLKKNKQTGKHYKEKVSFDTKNRIFGEIKIEQNIERTIDIKELQEVLVL